MSYWDGNYYERAKYPEPVTPEARRKARLAYQPFYKKVEIQLKKQGVEYELNNKDKAIEYISCKKTKVFVPCFVMSDGMIIECVSGLLARDCRKYLLLREQHPDLDIRFVFEIDNMKILGGDGLSLAEWAASNRFHWAKKLIPLEWMVEIASPRFKGLTKIRKPSSLIAKTNKARTSKTKGKTVGTAGETAKGAKKPKMRRKIEKELALNPRHIARDS